MFNELIILFTYPAVQDNLNWITTKRYKAQWRAPGKQMLI